MKEYGVGIILISFIIVLGLSPSISALGISPILGRLKPAAYATAVSQTTAHYNNFSALVSDISQNASTNTCLQYTNHEYEVCVAYIFNSSTADLVPFYTYVHSPNTSLARFVSYRLGSRYVGQANTLIANRTVNWPIGNMEVAVPAIKVLSVDSSLATNSATLNTEETWRVATESGHVLFQETNSRHAITMRRAQSYLLHKWVVTRIE